MNLLTAKTIKGAFVAVVGALSFAGLSGAAHASVEPINVYQADLDANWSYLGAPHLDQYGPAILNGMISLGSDTYGPSSGLTLNDMLNSGTQTSVGPNNLFSFQYSFTVSGPGNTGGTYVSQLTNVSNSIDALSLALYGPSGFLAAGTAGTGPSAGEVVLNYAGLNAGATYNLVVMGALDPSATQGFFTGSATVSEVPLPGAVLMFGSALLGLVGFAGRRRFLAFGSRLTRDGGRAAAVVAAVGVALGLMSYAGSAEAALYTDIANLGSWTPTNPAGPNHFFNGLINTAKPSPLSTPGATTVSQSGSGTLTGFTFDYEFTLTKGATIDAILSQSHTTVTSGTSFELFKGTPGSPTHLVNSTVGTGAATGELQLHYAGLTAGSYFLQIVSTTGLTSGKVGTLTGLVSVTAVPLPGALIMFGSVVVGLVGVGRRARVRAA